jgi:hypothetical protein
MPQPTANQFSGIFVCYRRDDSSGHAGRLYDKLGDHFGTDRIFMDIDKIEPGEDFVAVIENAVGSCDILIAVIGQRWLPNPNQESSWFDNPNDFVRLEISAALNRDIRVIPVLVQKVSMPKPQDLPDDLVQLCRRNAVELSDLRWRRDVEHLIDVLERILSKQEAMRRQQEQERQRRGDETRERAETRQAELEKAEEQEEIRSGEMNRLRDQATATNSRDQPESVELEETPTPLTAEPLVTPAVVNAKGAAKTELDQTRATHSRRNTYVILAGIVTLMIVLGGSYVYRNAKRTQENVHENTFSAPVDASPMQTNTPGAEPTPLPSATVGSVNSPANRPHTRLNNTGTKRKVPSTTTTSSEADKKIDRILHPR